MRGNPDNGPDLISAIEFEALDNGGEANLDEKPNNGVEISPGGPFLLRLLHQKQVRKSGQGIFFDISWCIEAFYCLFVSRIFSFISSFWQISYDYILIDDKSAVDFFSVFIIAVNFGQSSFIFSIFCLILL